MSSQQLNWACLIALVASERIVAIEGEPAVFKTLFFKVLAKMLQKHFAAINIGNSMPEDWRGIPYRFDRADGSVVMRFGMDEAVQECLENESIFLLDEATGASEQTLSACQQFLLEMAGLPNCQVAAVYNPAECATAGWTWSDPMVTRSVLTQWEYPFESFMHRCTQGSWLEPELPVIPEGWQALASKYWSVIGSFCEKRAEWAPRKETYATRRPPEMIGSGTQYATPRGYEAMASCLALAEAVGANAEVKRQLVFGCIGDAAGTEFLNHDVLSKLPDVNAWLDNPELIRKQLPTRGDLQNICMMSIPGAVAMRGTPAAFEAGYDVLEVAWEHVPNAKGNCAAVMGPLWSTIEKMPAGFTPKDRSGKLQDMYDMLTAIKKALKKRGLQ